MYTTEEIKSKPAAELAAWYGRIRDEFDPPVPTSLKDKDTIVNRVRARLALDGDLAFAEGEVVRAQSWDADRQRWRVRDIKPLTVADVTEYIGIVDVFDSSTYKDIVRRTVQRSTPQDSSAPRRREGTIRATTLQAFRDGLSPKEIVQVVLLIHPNARKFDLETVAAYRYDFKKTGEYIADR